MELRGNRIGFNEQEQHIADLPESVWDGEVLDTFASVCDTRSEVDGELLQPAIWNVGNGAVPPVQPDMIKALAEEQRQLKNLQQPHHSVSGQT